jgi:eukaryotic-like serine/threonine-protein kinase
MNFSETPAVYAFGPYRLDPTMRRLSRGPEVVPLTSKALDTLTILVRHAGQTVSKDLLLKCLWPAAVVEENNLNQAISRVRKVLGDDRERPTYIATIPGCGYRFVAPVRAIDASDSVAVPAGLGPGERPRRVIVLPFHVLKADSETDFLAVSLPDALTTALSNISALVVRSSVIATRFASRAPDLSALAREGVDVALTGTLLCADGIVRVNTQLVTVPDGTVLWSQMLEAPREGIFRLQDQLTRIVARALSLNLSAHDRNLLQQDLPATARAYELYLRANRCSYDRRQAVEARDLYLECLSEDSQYASAWARLGRIYRLLALGSGDAEGYRKAQHAFRRALEINPDLPLAHNLYTYLEVELGGAADAMARLLRQTKLRPANADVFAGLVHACRYCGLLDEALAAYQLARERDPDIRTSVAHTYLMRGSYTEAIATDVEVPMMAAIHALVALGRCGEAVDLIATYDAQPMPAAVRGYLEAWRSLLSGRTDDAAEACRSLRPADYPQDPCGRFYVSRLLAAVGDHARAVVVLRSSVEGGFFFRGAALQHDEVLRSLVRRDDYAAVIREAETRQQAAEARFREADGPAVLPAR